MLRKVEKGADLTRDEQKMITEFLHRAVHGAPGAALPPLDIEADAIIRALFVRNPEAAYRVTMLAIGQARELDAGRAALAETHARIREGWFWRLFRKPTETRRMRRADRACFRGPA
jgi:hypothetical protein